MPISTDYQYLTGIVKNSNNGKIVLDGKGWAVDLQNTTDEKKLEEVRQQRWDHFSGKNFLGYCPIIKQKVGKELVDKATFITVDVDNVFLDEGIPNFYKTNIGKYGFEIISRSGDRHFTWYFSPGKKGIFPKADLFRNLKNFPINNKIKQNNINQLAYMLGQGLGYNTPKELKHLKLPDQNYLDIKALFPGHRVKNPLCVWGDYWNGFNETNGGVIDPDDPERILNIKEFFDLLEGGRTITADLALEWLDALTYMIPCHRRAYIQGLEPNTSRNTDLSRILGNYFSKNKKATVEKAMGIMGYVSRFDDEFYEEGKALVENTAKDPSNKFGHCESTCNEFIVCGENEIKVTSQPGKSLAKITISPKEEYTDEEQLKEYLEDENWHLPNFYGTWTALQHKTCLQNRLFHTFSTPEGTGSVPLKHGEKIGVLEKLSENRGENIMLRTTDSTLRKLIKQLYIPTVILHAKIEAKKGNILYEQLKDCDKEEFKEEFQFTNFLFLLAARAEKYNKETTALTWYDEKTNCLVVPMLLVNEIEKENSEFGPARRFLNTVNYNGKRGFEQVKRTLTLEDQKTIDYHAYLIPLDFFIQEGLTIKQLEGKTDIQYIPENKQVEEPLVEGDWEELQDRLNVE